MIKIFKSQNTKQIYIETVASGFSEDFVYYRNGDLFTIDRVNTKIVEVNEANYSLFVDNNGNSFGSANDFETYLVDILQIETVATVKDLNQKRNLNSQKNSIEDDFGDLQLVGDENSPGNNKVYGTDSSGNKGWYDQAPGGDVAYVNESALYKTFSDTNPGINNSTTYQTLNYKAAQTGTYDDTIFAPVANGVQLLKDLINVTIIGSVFVEDNVGQRVSIGVSVTINGTPSTVEGTGYIRRASGQNEDQHKTIETFPSLSAGDVITISGKRNAVASGNANGIEDKGILSVFGFVPDSPGVVIGFPSPIITSISLT